MLLAVDNFGRTIALNSGWGSDDLGNAWTTFQATTQITTDFGVDGTEGQMAISAAASNRVGLLGGITVINFDILVKVQLSATPTGAAMNYYILPRTTIASAGRTGYRFQVQQAITTNAGTAFIKSVNAGTETPITQASLGTLTASTWYWMRALGIGPNLNFKVWADGTTEPGTWNVQATDSTFASGVVGVMGFGTSGNTNLPTILWDNLTVDDATVSQPTHRMPLGV